MNNKIFATFIESSLGRRYFKDSRLNPVVKTNEMTQDVGLGDDGKLYTNPGSTIHGSSTQNDIDDADEMAFYDDSESVQRKTTWSNIKNKLKTYFNDLYVSKTKYNPVERTLGMTVDVGQDSGGKLYTYPVNIHNQLQTSGPVDQDEFILYDTTVSDNRIIKWSNIKNKLKTYFNDLYVSRTTYNPVSKTSAMTQPVGVDPYGKLFTASSPVNPITKGSDMVLSVGKDSDGLLYAQAPWASAVKTLPNITVVTKTYTIQVTSRERTGGIIDEDNEYVSPETLIDDILDESIAVRMLFDDTEYPEIIPASSVSSARYRMHDDTIEIYVVASPSSYFQNGVTITISSNSYTGLMTEARFDEWMSDLSRFPLVPWSKIGGNKTVQQRLDELYLRVEALERGVPVES